MKREREGQSAEDIMKLFKQLSASEQARFVRLLKGGESGVGRHGRNLTEQRFSDGRGCPICRGMHGLCPIESVGLCARGDLQLKITTIPF